MSMSRLTYSIIVNALTERKHIFIRHIQRFIIVISADKINPWTEHLIPFYCRCNEAILLLWQQPPLNRQALPLFLWIYEGKVKTWILATISVTKHNTTSCARKEQQVRRRLHRKLAILLGSLAILHTTHQKTRLIIKI